MAKNDAGAAVSQELEQETAVQTPILDEVEFPKRLRLRGQWCDRVDSPLPDYPGCIYVVTNMSSPQFMRFWEMTHAAPEGAVERYNYLWDYGRRQHLVLDWHVQGVNEAHVADDTSGKSLPAVELAGFVVNATWPTVIRAMNLPNLPGWWPNITPTATSEGEMGE
jgi:hypothetical protein